MAYVSRTDSLPRAEGQERHQSPAARGEGWPAQTGVIPAIGETPRRRCARSFCGMSWAHPRMRARHWMEGAREAEATFTLTRQAQRTNRSRWVGWNGERFGTAL